MGRVVWGGFTRNHSNASLRGIIGCNLELTWQLTPNKQECCCENWFHISLWASMAAHTITSLHSHNCYIRISCVSLITSFQLPLVVLCPAVVSCPAVHAPPPRGHGRLGIRLPPWTHWLSLIPKPQPLTSKNQVEFLGLAHTFATMSPSNVQSILHQTHSKGTNTWVDFYCCKWIPMQQSLYTSILEGIYFLLPCPESL